MKVFKFILLALILVPLFYGTVFWLSMSEVSPSQAHKCIARHLGVSKAGVIIITDVLGPGPESYDYYPFLDKLKNAGDEDSVTAVLALFYGGSDYYTTKVDDAPEVMPIAEIFARNSNKTGSTLLKPEDITNVLIEDWFSGRTVGSFDWVVPGYMKGRGRFILTRGVTGPKLEYLGVRRKNPVHIYDCVTVLSTRVRFQQWEGASSSYKAWVKPAAESARQSSISDQLKAFKTFADEINLTPSIIDTEWDAEENAVVITLGVTDYIWKIIEQDLRKSDDWTIHKIGRIAHIYDELLELHRAKPSNRVFTLDTSAPVRAD